jgi:hypothetical protein
MVGESVEIRADRGPLTLGLLGLKLGLALLLGGVVAVGLSRGVALGTLAAPAVGALGALGFGLYDVHRISEPAVQLVFSPAGLLDQRVTPPQLVPWRSIHTLTHVLGGGNAAALVSLKVDDSVARASFWSEGGAHQQTLSGDRVVISLAYLALSPKGFEDLVRRFAPHVVVERGWTGP